MSTKTCQFLVLILTLSLLSGFLSGCTPKPYIDKVNDIDPNDMILSDFAQNGQTKECPLYRDLKTDIFFGANRQHIPDPKKFRSTDR